jgi:NADH-quinone oxidoreductase subunit N
MQAFDLFAILPELVLLVATCLLLVVSVYVPEKVTSTPGVEQDIFHTPRGVGFVYFFSLILLAYLSFMFIGRMGDPALVAMNGLFQSDPFSNLLKACSCIAVLVSLVYSKQYLVDRATTPPLKFSDCALGNANSVEDDLPICGADGMRVISVLSHTGQASIPLSC